jgi:TRAP transporter TAXI family solute receptor
MRITRFAVMVLAVLAPACGLAPVSPPPRTIVRLESAPPGSFGAALAQEYSRLSDKVEVKALERPPDPFEALERGDADAFLVPADTAYFAYSKSTDEHRVRGLRALATLPVIPIHLVVGGGTSIHTVEGLRGRTIGVGGNSALTNLLLRALTLTGEARQTNQGVALLTAGKLDALLLLSYYPALDVVNAVRGGARLISIAGAAVEMLHEEYPFIRLVTIPAYTYEGQAEPLYTVGVDVVYVCRGDLPEPVVYELTKRLFDALPTLAKGFPTLRPLDVTRAAATPIPLHDGAARYYREVELLP